MLGSVSGIHRSATRGSSVEFAEYRKYAPGDDLRHLDWRVYARSDRFYMKEFEADTNLRCYLALDTSGSMAFSAQHGSKLDYARRLAATLAYLLAYQGDAVGLLCVAQGVVHDIPPRRNPLHLKGIFDFLATVRAEGVTQLAEGLHGLAERIKQRALVILFSDLFTEVRPLVACFEHLRFRKHDLAVFHLLDRQEVTFDFDRPIRFQDLETADAWITDPAIIRSAYRRDVEAYLAALKQGCDEFAVDYRRVFTDEDYERVVAAFLLERLRHKSGASSK